MKNSLQELVQRTRGRDTAAQAAAFATEWSVVDQYTATGIFGQTWTGTGFSATLFKNNHTGQYSFAIRGSTGINDFDSDASLIATDGIAVSQLVELYNYWQSLTSTNSYQAARLTLQVAETASLALAMLNPAIYAAFNKIVFGAGITPDQIKLSLGSLKIQVGSLMNDTLSGRAANDARYECERRVA
jgi:hypothetical protein